MIFQNNLKNLTSNILSILFVVFCVTQITAAQDLSVDAIIAKNIEARGGESNWKNVNSIKMTGTYVNFSNPEEFIIYRMRDNLYRFDTKRLNKFTIHAFDGKNAWWVNPLMGEQFEKPSQIPNANNLDKVTLRERFFEPIFWNYKAKGNQVELLGKEDIDGEEVYKLKITLKDKSVETWCISAETFLEVCMNGKTYDFGTPNNFEVFFSDFREIEGVKMPYLVESEYGIRYRSLEIDNIEINKNVDKKVFEMPDPENWKP